MQQIGTDIIVASLKPKREIKTYLKTFHQASSRLVITLSGPESVFRAGLRPAANRENLKLGPPAGRKPAGGPILKLSRLESGRNPAEVRPGNKISGPEALLRNIGHVDFVEFHSLPAGHAKTILCSFFVSCFSFFSISLRLSLSVSLSLSLSLSPSPTFTRRLASPTLQRSPCSDNRVHLATTSDK